MRKRETRQAMPARRDENRYDHRSPLGHELDTLLATDESGVRNWGCWNRWLASS